MCYREQRYKFPIKEPEYLTYYRDSREAIVRNLSMCDHCENSRKFFRFNPENHYTHEDIKVARKYGMSIQSHTGRYAEFHVLQRGQADEWGISIQALRE
jgi:hypothetical protein